MKPTFARTGGLLLLGVSLGGCRFSASASADVKSAGDAKSESGAQASGGTALEKALHPTIQFKEGKLDYQGVINFEYDKADLKKDAATESTLAEFKKFLTEHADVHVEVEGHTDSRGSDQYNRDLSDRRAASVKKWLIDGGISKDRLTSVGKGEDHPQVPEPDACNDKEPKDTAPCEEPWAANRRVVFQVTKGAETLPTEPPPAPPPAAPPPAAPAAALHEECPWLWGGHFNALGPNSWVTVAGATQPGVCWLELSLGVGLGFGDLSTTTTVTDVTGDIDVTGDGRYLSLTVPLRARFWFMQTHSVIADAGFGFSHYWMWADLDPPSGVTADGDWKRNTTPLIGFLGAGYGYRGNGAQAGPRLALIVGGLVHMTKFASSTVRADGSFVGEQELGAALDRESDDLHDLEPYGEVSFGWLF